MNIASTARWAVGAAVAIAVLALLARTPPLVGALNARARENDSLTADGRLTKSADTLDIDNPFVIAALQIVPMGATFAVARPASRTAIAPITYDALPGYFQYVLMPRREAPLRSADYVLCYGCARARLQRHTHWLWSGAPGLRIGRLGTAR